MGVYTKNRCFRLYLCSKYGTTDPRRVLRPVDGDPTQPRSAIPPPRPSTQVGGGGGGGGGKSLLPRV
jgi:hypothetical protein